MKIEFLNKTEGIFEATTPIVSLKRIVDCQNRNTSLL